MKKEYLGKLYLSNFNELYVLCGYDYLTDSYLLYKLKEDENDTFWKFPLTYKSIKEKELENLITIEEYKQKIEKQKAYAVKFKEKLNIYYDYLEVYRREPDFHRVFKRYKETYGNFMSLKYLLNIMSKNAESQIKYEKDVNLYKRELQKTEKGLKRIKKRFHCYFGDNDEKMLNLLNESSKKDIHDIIFISKKNFTDIERLEKNLDNLKIFLKKYNKGDIISEK